MIVLTEWFQQVNDMLPEGVKAKTISVYPLPYKGYYELWVEGEDTKRYRGLCTEQALISDLAEFVLPQGMQQQGVR